MHTIMKRYLNSDDQQFHQHRQNKPTTSHLKSSNTKKTMTFTNGNQGPGLGQAHKYGRVKPVDGIPTLPFLIIE